MKDKILVSEVSQFTAEVDYDAIFHCIEKLFEDDAEWLNRMCGIKNQNRFSLFVLRSPKP